MSSSIKNHYARPFTVKNDTKNRQIGLAQERNLNYVQLIMKMTFNRKHGENNKDKKKGTKL